MSIDVMMYVIGGLVLFLYGLTHMSKELRLAAGNRLRALIDKTTNRPWKSILAGLILTILLQTSSGSTVLIIGLLRSGLLGLPQAIGMIFGANVGTTMTAFIIGLPIAKYGLWIISIGVLLMISSKKQTKHIGGAIFGLGLMFFGLSTMESGLKPLAATPFAESLFLEFSRHWYSGLLFSTGFTSIIQSSSASIGVIQKLYELNQTGVETFTLAGAIPMIVGANIGTTVTAMIASIGGNKDAKRAALTHVLFNLFGGLLVILFLRGYTELIALLEIRYLTPYSMLSIALAHGIQNIINTLILMSFIPYMVKLVTYLIKDVPSDIKPMVILDEKVLTQSPIIALESTKNAIIGMFDTVSHYLNIVESFVAKFDKNVLEESRLLERMLDTYDDKIHDYLIKLTEYGIEHEQSELLSKYLDTVKDLERIGDHLTNLMEFFVERYEVKQPMTSKGKNDFNIIYAHLKITFDTTFKAFVSEDPLLAEQVYELEDQLDQYERQFRKNYIERIKNKEATRLIYGSFGDILVNIERMGDHLMNIAENVIEPTYEKLRTLHPKINY